MFIAVLQNELFRLGDVSPFFLIYNGHFRVLLGLLEGKNHHCQCPIKWMRILFFPSNFSVHVNHKRHNCTNESSSLSVLKSVANAFFVFFFSPQLVLRLTVYALVYLYFTDMWDIPGFSGLKKCLRICVVGHLESDSTCAAKTQ